jgi:hypothetical protein
MMSSKKKIAIKVSQSLDTEVLFFDESRFGTHSKVGHGWFKRGTRPRVKISMGFKNFYVYSAINSKTGYNFNLILPYVNTYCMNLYLKRLAMDMHGKKCILIMDGASWHRSTGLVLPTNIEIVYLPPYSPELNPVERLWNYLKSNTIKNRFYSSIAALEMVICGFLRKISNQTIMSVCSCDYMSN